MDSILMNTITTYSPANITTTTTPPINFKTSLLNPTNILASLLFYLTINIIISFTRSPKYPTNIPWVGHGPSWLAAPLNVLSSFTKTATWMSEGYNAHSKHGRTFVLPGGLGSPPEIIVPRSEMRWFLDQPDNVTSTSEAHFDILHGQYSFADPVLLGDPYHEHVVHKNLARNMNGLMPLLSEGIPRDVDFVFGRTTTTTKPGEWKSVNLMDSLMEFVPRASNRIIVGEPVCENLEYLGAVSAFMSDVVRGMLIFGLCPQALHPVLGAISGLAPRYHYWVSSKHSLPVIKQRLLDIEKKESGDPNYKTWKEPNDYISWHIKTARAEGRTDELQPSLIAKRIMPLNFAAIHTTSMTSHSAILDILSSDPSVLQALREEASRVYEQEGHQWTKQGLQRMYRLDSALRESQRFSAFAQTFLSRKVIVKEGITKPDGVHCEYGTVLSAPWVELSKDKDLHGGIDSDGTTDDGAMGLGGADVYDAFRYSRAREAYEALPAEERDKEGGLTVLQSGQVTTSDKHLPFGHGRHAW